LDRKLTETKPVEVAKNKPGVPLAPGREKILKKEKEAQVRKEQLAINEANKPKQRIPRKASKPA